MASDAYEEALGALSKLISQQKRTKGESWENAFAAMQVFLEVSSSTFGPEPNHCFSSTIDVDGIFLQRLKLQDAIKKLKVIHVAGTKGKVSHAIFSAP